MFYKKYVMTVIVPVNQNHNISMKLKIKKLTDSAIIPTKAHKTDLGYDLYADETVTIQSPEVVKIKTGIVIGFPEGWGGFIKDRSSMASKGFIVSGGVIDNAYIGEISVLISYQNPNKSDKTCPSSKYIIHEGDKIAQLVLIPATDFPIEEVDDLGETDRGEKGFGSSGK